ncbi:AAA family ATPase [Demequina globuliformis]|uniref:AAA family ATPase n=1 Tax=Demequina globuliformis TaxID=676202 RepID=UPI0007806012|nr:ATP-binding protein [Demequina globuliformis]
MTQVVMVCGPAGSGKSAHARRLTTNGYALLSFDAIAWELGFRKHPLLDKARLAVHRVLQERLASLLDRGESVVIDSSFWSRASRDTYRQILAHRGVEPVVHYIAAPPEVILDRLAKRTDSGPDDIMVPATRAQVYMDGFEVPQAAEGPVVWIDGS